MRQRTRLAGLLVALACAGIVSACGDPPTSPAPIGPGPINTGPVNPRPVEPDLYKGNYMLTVELGETCSSLPAAARTRNYSATIEDYQSPGLIADYLVTLSGATFAPGCGSSLLFKGLGCNQFFATKYFGGLTF